MQRNFHIRLKKGIIKENILLEAYYVYQSLMFAELPLL